MLTAFTPSNSKSHAQTFYSILSQYEVDGQNGEFLVVSQMFSSHILIVLCILINILATFGEIRRNTSSFCLLSSIPPPYPLCIPHVSTDNLSEPGLLVTRNTHSVCPNCACILHAQKTSGHPTSASSLHLEAKCWFSLGSHLESSFELIPQISMPFTLVALTIHR